MPAVVITGSNGLIASEAAAFYAQRGFLVLGIDNDMRARFLGTEASTRWKRTTLLRDCAQYVHYEVDIRDRDATDTIFREDGSDIVLVIHAAAQPWHDWAARDPHTDFTINANGTLTMLEATRQFCPDAAFVFTSTNKVYGDRPNELPLIEQETRWEIDPRHPYTVFGYNAKQVPDNIHSHDYVTAVDHVYRDPGIGDHVWWITNTRRFAERCPAWNQRYDLRSTLEEMLEQQVVRSV